LRKAGRSARRAEGRGGDRKSLRAGVAIHNMGLEMLTGITKRKMYNTTLDSELIRRIKILAAQLEKRQNDLLEEAIKDLLHKYDMQSG
jgi:hydroxypyruvate isomerase